MGFLHSNAMENGVLSMDAGHSLITKNSIKAMSSPILIPLSHSFCTYYQRTYPFPIKHLIQIKLFEYEHNICTVCSTSGFAHRCPVGPTTKLVSTETLCVSAFTILNPQPDTPITHSQAQGASPKRQRVKELHDMVMVLINPQPAKESVTDEGGAHGAQPALEQLAVQGCWKRGLSLQWVNHASGHVTLGKPSGFPGTTKQRGVNLGWGPGEEEKWGENLNRDI